MLFPGGKEVRLNCVLAPLASFAVAGPALLPHPVLGNIEGARPRAGLAGSLESFLEQNAQGTGRGLNKRGVSQRGKGK